MTERARELLDWARETVDADVFSSAAVAENVALAAIAAALSSARDAVIEECAKVAENMPEEKGDACDWIKERIADAIRSLKGTHPTPAPDEARDQGRQQERAAVIAWLENTNFGDDAMDVCSLTFAHRIAFGDHLEQGGAVE